jgi:glycosyltransferase involved in cell wall biosynthesis
LVVSADSATVQDFLRDTPLPLNLAVSQGKPSVHPFYQNASVVLNLSLPDGWVETFGLTALEAMAYGLPVIVPPVGGIAEIVPHGLVGLHADARNIIAVSAALEQILASDYAYTKFSEAALAHARGFSPEAFAENLVGVFQSIQNSER